MSDTWTPATTASTSRSLRKSFLDQAQALLRRNAAEQPSYSLKNPYGFLLRCDACGYGCMQHVSNRASQLAYYRCESAGRAASTASLLSTSTPASSSASPRRPSACTNAWTIRPGAFCAQTQSSGLPRRRRWPGWTRRSLTRSNSSAAGLPSEKIETRLAAIQTEREKLSRQLALLSGRRQSPSGEPRGAARPPERHRGTHRYRGLRRVLHLGLGRHELRAAPVTPPRASRVDPSRRRPHGHHLQGRHPSASADIGGRRKPDLTKPLLQLGLGLAGAKPPSGFTVARASALVCAGFVPEVSQADGVGGGSEPRRRICAS